jgi:hypothetical protein
MLFGYDQVCKDKYFDSTNRTCSTNFAPIDNMESYNKAAYSLYSITFGQDINNRDVRFIFCF